MKERSGMPYDVVAYEADELARLLSPAEEGIFHRMLRLAWMNGSIPSDITALAELCRVRPTTMQKAWPHLSPLWQPLRKNPSRLENKKQKSERIFLKAKRNQNSEAAKLRWKLQKEKTIVDANALPTQSIANAPLPSPPHPNPTIKKGKEKHTYGKFMNVLLTDPEHGKLCSEFGLEGANQRIERISSYVASKGVRYRSHYATILVWEEKNKGAENGNQKSKAELRSERQTRAVDQALRDMAPDLSRDVQDAGERGIDPGEDQKLHSRAFGYPTGTA